MRGLSNILFLFILSSFASFAQQDSTVFVPGTHCSMIPPNGFVIADRFTGFQNNSTGASIMITEIPESYEKLIPHITPEALMNQRMSVIETQKIQFNGTEATFVSASQSQGGVDYRKLILFFGSDSSTIMVNGIFPITFKNLEPSITKSILTTTFHKNNFTESGELFTINAAGTNFKLVSKLGLNRIYSTDSLSAENSDLPKFIISNSVDRVSKENRKTYAESRIMKLPRGDSNKIISSKEITIDGLDGYEIIAEGQTATGKKQKMYEVILYNVEGEYYIMLGAASNEIEKNMKVFKQLSNSFTLRKS